MQPPRRVLSRAGLMLAMLALAGCATTAEVTKGGGATIGEAQAEKYDGPKARITVGAIVDKTGAADKKGSLRYQLDVLRRRSSSPESFQSENVVGGIRDLVTTALFQSNRFIVLEREAISETLVEQEFSASGKVGEASRIPIGQVEGAELLVVGALTGFDAAAAGGGGFPIPIPINRGRDFVVLDVEIRKSHVAMDLRVIDVRTGRIVSTVAVEGSARKFGAGLSGFARTRHGGMVRIPTVLRGFANTPVEKAISEMVDAAVTHIVEKTPPVYFHFEAPDSGKPPPPATKPPAR
ncbi:MAG TPA: CsgG/HfaB family protein [Acidiferrobacterales bacterium]|nr:CsgG/HfaB family protein [Acidiferrobacterales bacterium]